MPYTLRRWWDTGRALYTMYRFLNARTRLELDTGSFAVERPEAA